MGWWADPFSKLGVAGRSGRGRPQVQKLADQGLIYLPNTTAQFQTRIAEETARWAQLIRENNLQLDQ